MHQNTRQIQVPTTMKASVYREFGGPEVLRYEDIPTPEPADGEALVKVLAVAIDYIQLHIRHGGSGRIGSSDEAHYGIKDPPHIPGGMACVEVMGLGPNSEGVEIGTRHLVGGLRPGSTVEYGVVDTESLQPRPDGRPSPTAYPASFTPAQAAAFDYAPVAYHTLKIAASLQSGRNCPHPRCCRWYRCPCGSTCQTFRRAGYRNSGQRSKTSTRPRAWCRCGD